MRIPLSHIYARAAERPAHYVEDVISRGTVDGNDLVIPDIEVLALLQKYRRPGLGDRIEQLAKPLAKLLDLPCLDKENQLKPESDCARRRDALNKAFPGKL